jgi:hypothetical protein
MKKFRSFALWPKSVYTGPDGLCVSDDGHDTESAARAVANGLRLKGWGGLGLDLPIKTWYGSVADLTDCPDCGTSTPGHDNCYVCANAAAEG